MQYTIKKSLGQHFLKDENICQRIVDELTSRPFERLVEVGPGTGALTKYLVKIPAIDFKAVELDREKVQYLEQAYPGIRGKLINEDFLDMNAPFEGDFTVVGNFPYNISTQILFKVLDWKDQVPEVIGMFQKEVAQRAASKAGNKVYGVLSVLIQAFYNVEYLFDVPPEAFNPSPKVISGVIRLTRRTDVPAMKSEKTFRMIVKAAFNQRRKTLRNAIRSFSDPAMLEDPFFNQRAEMLTVDDFAALTFRLQQL